MWQRVANQVATKEAILNPFTFYYQHADDWCLSHSYEFWSKGNTVATITNQKIVKTIFDPSISGYILPSSAAFTGFTKYGTNTFQSSEYNVSGAFLNGWSFYTMGWKSGLTFHLYALGWRNTYNSDGSITSYEYGGTYWTAIMASNTMTYQLHIEPVRINPQDSYYRSNGRCCLSTLEY